MLPLEIESRAGNGSNGREESGEPLSLQKQFVKLLTQNSPGGFFGDSERQRDWLERKKETVKRWKEDALANLFPDKGHMAYICFLNALEGKGLYTVKQLVRQRKAYYLTIGLGPLQQEAVNFIAREAVSLIIEESSVSFFRAFTQKREELKPLSLPERLKEILTRNYPDGYCKEGSEARWVWKETRKEEADKYGDDALVNCLPERAHKQVTAFWNVLARSGIRTIPQLIKRVKKIERTEEVEGIRGVGKKGSKGPRWQAVMTIVGHFEDH